MRGPPRVEFLGHGLDELDGENAQPSRPLLSAPSAWTESLLAEYQRLGLDTWTNKRVFTVARMFHCTVPELCAVAGEFDQEAIRRYLNDQWHHWPMTLTLQWNKLARARAGMREPDAQDIGVARNLNWSLPPLPLPKRKKKLLRCERCGLRWRRPGKRYCLSCSHLVGTPAL